MKRIINVFSIVVLFCLCAAARPAGDWKVYSTFNDWHKRVIDTKDRVYLVTLCQPTLSWLPSYNDIYSSLFVYDKESDEIEAWNQRNRLSGNTIQRVAYNPSNDCLIVVYSDSNIDFIYGNGDVINVPGIVNASITFSKKVNGINIDQEKDRVYFATDFGYVVVDAKKVCGILTEMNTEIDYINYVVIGAGINVNQKEFPTEIQDTASSLCIALGENISRAELMAAVMEALERFYEIFLKTQDLTELYQEYNTLCVNCGRQVRVLEPGHEYIGTAVGINKNGELIVRRENGEQTLVYAGEVSVRGVYGYV